MVNIEDFVIRLQKVMDHYGESASSFAEKIGVQRSSISHILSGRNKPSLDFILKILYAFPKVDLYWLLNGKGEFLSKSKPEEIKEIKQKIDPSSFNKELPFNEELPFDISNDKKTIERIVIFYSDGSFKNYQN
ncbi:helix-turn-helix domain-containing protein [Flavivirga jejuensis]|uniref:Helix-turn-helix transcriptional regulator n=1 Tax=Flavivirga jejuensis TaxID=870487 RepID=A0ABT8WS72_9FLAO|nr:helix-turn-helix transcriptional regulator [Flavivirga jejuensis]MDO5975819.1 helix-turn-helix transcriptional regulator [Flavivirga jejuensis]